MVKRTLNSHVFGQSIYNWLQLPSDIDQVVEVPIPPVKGVTEVLVYITATFADLGEGDHHYAAYTRSSDADPIPYHHLFVVGSVHASGTGCNSDNFWLPMPGEGMPRVVCVQKMSGGAINPNATFRSGVTVLTMR